MEDYQIMNLIKILIKEVRSFKECKEVQDFKVESLAVDGFIKILDIIYTKLSHEVFYSYLVKSGYNLFSLNDFDFVQAVLKISS